MRKCKGLILGTAAGLAAGAALGWALTEASVSPMERMLHRKLACARGALRKWTGIFGL